jgi:hypothetical protein
MQKALECRKKAWMPVKEGVRFGGLTPFEHPRLPWWLGLFSVRVWLLAGDEKSKGCTTGSADGH